MNIRFLGLIVLITPCLSWAGYDEGMAAYAAKDYVAALREFRPLTAQGDAMAQNQLGVMYEYGEGVPLDYSQALAWFTKAADQGYGDAMVHLGEMYGQGWGASRDNRLAAHWGCMAMSLGHFAVMDRDHPHQVLRFGCLSNSSDEQTLNWLKTWAARNDSYAANMLGSHYEHLPKVQDYAEALRWYQIAAEGGLSLAQFNLGMMYKNGEGVPQDYPTALKWFRMAARQGGNISVLDELADMYLNGIGVPKDVVLAHFFLSVIPGGLHKLAGSYVHNANYIVAQYMSADQLAEAHALEANWKVGDPVPESSKTGR